MQCFTQMLKFCNLLSCLEKGEIRCWGAGWKGIFTCSWIRKTGKKWKSIFFYHYIFKSLSFLKKKFFLWCTTILQVDDLKRQLEMLNGEKESWETVANEAEKKTLEASLRLESVRNYFTSFFSYCWFFRPMFFVASIYLTSW